MPVKELSREQENLANELAEKHHSVRVTALADTEDVLMTGVNESGQDQETWRVDEDGNKEAAEYVAPSTLRERLEASDIGPAARPVPVGADRFRIFVDGQADTATRTRAEAANSLRWALLTGRTVKVVRHDPTTGKERKLTATSLKALLAEAGR